MASEQFKKLDNAFGIPKGMTIEQADVLLEFVRSGSSDIPIDYLNGMILNGTPNESKMAAILRALLIVNDRDVAYEQEMGERP